MAFYRSSCLLWLTFEPQGFPVETTIFSFDVFSLIIMKIFGKSCFFIFKNTCLFLYIGLLLPFKFVNLDTIWRDLPDKLLISIGTVQILYVRGRRLFPSHNPNSTIQLMCRKGRRLQSVFSFYLILDADEGVKTIVTQYLNKTHCSLSNSQKLQNLDAQVRFSRKAKKQDIY